jgi:AcrR family transcriptional regulator
MGIAERKLREFRRREREILDAALGLCAGDDWQGVTVEQIAERAEIGKGTVYKHFASKEEIYARLAADFQRQALERLEAIDSSLPVIGRLRAVIAAFWEQHRGGGEYQRLVQYCERDDFRRGLPEEVQAELTELDERFQAQIHGLLQEGIDEGILPRKPLPALVFGPMAALTGAVRLMRGDCGEAGQAGEAVEPESLLDELTNFVLAGMLYQEWLADEGLGEAETRRRAAEELRRAEADLNES